jgi:hypothetical protein
MNTKLVQGNCEAEKDIQGAKAVDMCLAVELDPHERGLLHTCRRTFGGTCEWRLG